MNMKKSLSSRSNGSRLPPEEIILRLARVPKDFESTGKASPAAFELSSGDESSVLQLLSVYARRLTTPNQARVLMDEKMAEYRLALFMKTECVRSVRPNPDSHEVPYLDAIWIVKLIEIDGEFHPDNRAGADGHAGISGLKIPEGLPRLHYKSLRAQLVEKVEETHLMPEI